MQCSIWLRAGVQETRADLQHESCCGGSIRGEPYLTVDGSLNVGGIYLPEWRIA